MFQIFSKKPTDQQQQQKIVGVDDARRDRCSLVAPRFFIDPK